MIVERAYDLAKKAHEGQRRLDGSPYFTHPEAVAKIVYDEWGITNEPDKIAAILLHDTVEDTQITLDQIRSEFGEEIAFLVDAVSKFGTKRETVKKVIDKTLINPWVAIIKLADRLHNMRTLQSMKPEKQAAIAQETLDAYSPLAESLGMWIVKTDLENLSFQYTNPEIYKEYSNLFNKDPRTKGPFLADMQLILENILKNNGFEGSIAIRKNSLIRLKDKKQPFGEIDDVVSFRVTTNRESCYNLMQKLREIFKKQEDPLQFDDFYESPRFNKYSALQMTLNYPFETDVKAIQIAVTSNEREDYNNWGIVSLIKKGETSLQEYALKLVFVPSGRAKFLPQNATGFDLAFLLDKERWAEATEVIINGQKCSISTIIPNGADVEILGKD